MQEAMREAMPALLVVPGPPIGHAVRSAATRWIWGGVLTMIEGIFGLIAAFGYGIVFLVVMAESAGLPVPGESSLLLASAFAATGRLQIAGVIAAAALGAILGDTGGYWVG